MKNVVIIDAIQILFHGFYSGEMSLQGLMEIRGSVSKYFN
jgi:hypothetical protein